MNRLSGEYIQANQLAANYGSHAFWFAKHKLTSVSVV